MLTHERFAIKFKLTTVSCSKSFGEFARFLSSSQSGESGQQRNEKEPHVCLDLLSVWPLFISVSFPGWTARISRQIIGHNGFLCGCFLWILSFLIQKQRIMSQSASASRRVSRQDSVGVRLCTFCRRSVYYNRRSNVRCLNTLFQEMLFRSGQCATGP